METVGEKLRRHREYRGMSLERAAKDMQMNARYLRLIEADDYGHLPADVYTKNFLRHYAEYLQLNAEIVVDRYSREKNIFSRTSTDTAYRTRKSWGERIVGWIISPATIKAAALLCVIAMVVSYLGWSVGKIFTPPELIITTPSEASMLTTARSISIAGVSEKEVSLSINDKPILSDTAGRFEITLDLQKGLNVVKITARKKHSRPHIVYRQIIVDDKDAGHVVSQR